MTGPLRYIFLAVTIYMFLILVYVVLERVDPREGTVPGVIRRGLRVIVEPYLKLVGFVTPTVNRGRVDWRAIVGITVLFIVIQVARLVS